MAEVWVAERLCAAHLSRFPCRRLAVDKATVNLIARVFAVCEGVRRGGRGRPLTELVRVLATFRRFLREGTPWRSLRASETQASGATLRRRLTEWARTDLLGQVHVTLIGLLRGHPDL